MSLTPEQFAQIERLFDAALELPGADRAAFLDDACADAGVRREVENLLAEDARLAKQSLSLAGRMEVARGRAAADMEPDTAAELAIPLPSTIGPYELVELIGEGGFGSVFRAEQSEPVQREVALKILKLGMDTRQVIARFEAERQALAVMEHPGIASVFDAGATDSGRPYFVMELVRGASITEYCDRGRLPLRQRLELFIEVCHAVQHAHQKGVIHRDIKPSNILVTRVDGTARPKVIDFGISKATESSPADKSMMSIAGQVMGTPAYMSPEQADPLGADIDTRTDIYSLGVLLYQLLTGSTPFNMDTMRRASLAEVQRMIREDEPRRPSARAATSDGLDEVAANRGIEPRKLAASLRGDLDWIILKAIEKDRERRFESASELAADIERHLNHEPVEAGPPSTAYRLRKLVRRNRGPFAAAGLLAVALIAGLIGTITFALREVRQRELAETNAAHTRDVASFQSDMLSNFDVAEMGQAIFTALRSEVAAAMRRTFVTGESGERRTPTEQEIDAELQRFRDALGSANLSEVARSVMGAVLLEPAGATVDESFADQPEVQAHLYQTLAAANLAIGRLDAAQTLFDRALELRRTSATGTAAEVAYTLDQTAQVLLARSEYQEAETRCRDALRALQEAIDGDHEWTASTLNTLSHILRDTGRLDEAVVEGRKALDMRRRLFGDEHEDVATSLHNLAGLMSDLRKYDEAETLFRQTLEMRKKLLGEEHARVASVMNNIGLLLQRKGDLAGAEATHREALAMARRVHGELHPKVGVSLNNLAVVLRQLDRVDEAKELYHDAIRLRRVLLGNEHVDVSHSLTNLATLLRTRGEYAEAADLYEESLAIRMKTLPPGHVLFALTRAGLGHCLARLDRYEEAEDHLLASEKLAMDSKVPPESFKMFILQCLVDLYQRWHEAEPAAGHDARAAQWQRALEERQA